MKIQDFSGLNDEQIIRNRKVYGENVFYPSFILPVTKKIKTILCHKITVFMMALIAITFVIALKVNGDGLEENKVFIMPAFFSIAAFFIFLIGLFDGLNNKFFVLLMLLFVAQLSLTIYDYINNNVQFTQFYYDFGFVLALLITSILKFFLNYKVKASFRNIIDFENDSLHSVIRNNQVCYVKRRELVVGDIIILNEGNIVPADCKILDDDNLEVDESYVNGANNVMKSHDSSFLTDSNHDCIFNGSFVLKGKCIARILKVGKESACHQKTFMQLAAFDSQEDTMEKDVSEYQSVLKVIGFSFAGLYLLGRLILFFCYKNNNLLLPFSDTDNFMKVSVISISCAVVMLLMTDPGIVKFVFSTAFSFNLKSLKNNCLLPRNINACFNLGKIDVLCVDETEILDKNIQSVSNSISSITAAGVDIIVLSSDSYHDVKPIALKVGLINERHSEDSVMTGKDLHNLSEKELMLRINKLKILSSASQNDKTRIIQLLKAKGLKVATTGLFLDESKEVTHADVAIASLSSLDIDKESADIILSDLSLKNIDYGIRWTKDLFNNIQHFLLFHAFFIFTICFVLSFGNFITTNIIFHPTHLIWFYAIVCCLAPFAFVCMPISEKLFNKTAIIKNNALINMRMIKSGLFLECIILIVITFCLYYLQQKNITAISNLFNIVLPHKKGLNIYEITILFSLISALMVCYLIYRRIEKYSFKFFVNIKENLVFIIVLAMFLLAIFLFVQTGHYICAVEHLRFTDWIVLFLISFLVFCIYSLFTIFFQKKTNAFTAPATISDKIKMLWPKLKIFIVKSFNTIWHGLKFLWIHCVKFLNFIIKSLIKLLIKVINLIQKWLE